MVTIPEKIVLADEEWLPRFCRPCGSPVKPGDNFCRQCGGKLKV